MTKGMMITFSSPETLVTYLSNRRSIYYRRGTAREMEKVGVKGELVGSCTKFEILVNE